MKNRITFIVVIVFFISFSCETPRQLNTSTDMKKDLKLYKVDTTEFAFETSGIIGIVTEDEQFCWALDLYAKENKLDESSVTPKFSFTELGVCTHYTYNSSFTWSNISAYDKAKDDWIGSFYIFDAHYFEADVVLNRKNNEAFIVSVKGKVNLNWETAPSTDFRSFEITNTVPFNGILSEIDDSDKALIISSKFIDISSMKWVPRAKTKSKEHNWIVHKTK